jgi:proton-coupled amino acid transporter
LEPFIALVGAIFLSTLGIFVPAFVQMIYNGSEYSDFGFLKWKLGKNGLLMCFAILALVTGAFTSIRDIVKIYTGEGHTA